MDRRIDILAVEPGKAPRPVAIPDTVEAAEAFLGGGAELGCFLPQRVMLISRWGRALRPTGVCQGMADV